MLEEELAWFEQSEQASWRRSLRDEAGERMLRRA